MKVIGLRTDSLPIEQPPEAARFVLNGVLDSANGDVFNYQNEEGTDLSYTAPTGYKFIGSINLANNEVVLFSTDNTTSEIGLFNKGVYTTLVSTECLNFSTDHLIKGEFKLLNGCDRVIYWNDDFNPDRQLNIDDLTAYQDTGDNWDCNLFKINPDFLIPYISDIDVNDTGGNLESGSYSFAVEILDNNLNTITVGLATPYIPLYAESINATYASINGSFSSTINAPEGGVTSVSKSITLALSNLDTRFSFARIIVAARVTGKGLAEEAYELTDYLPITSDTLEYTFVSLDNAVRTDIDRLKIKNPKYTTSKDMEQVDGRLVRINVRETSRDYSQYQRTANSIIANWIRVSEFPEDISEDHNTKNPKSYFNGNTFIGDEIYALGIVYVFSDGSTSPVFHIPGREATVSDNDTLTVVNSPTTGTTINVHDAAHLGLTIGETIERWKFYNTATGVTSGNFGYYESSSGTYPLDLDCNGEYIYGDLAGTPIRHHKFPDRKKIPTQFLNSAGQTRVSKLGVEFSNITYPDTDIVGHYFVKAKRGINESTVVDMGILSCPVSIQYEGFPDIDDNYVFAYQDLGGLNQNTVVKSFISPKILASLNSTGDYFKFIHYIDWSDYDGETEDRDNIEVNVAGLTFNSTVESMQTFYRNIERSNRLSPNTILNSNYDKPVVNYSLSNSQLIVELNENLLEVSYPRGVIVAELKRNVQPYNNLYQLQYEPITPLLTTSSSQQSYIGEGFTTLFEYYNLYAINAARDGFLNLNSSLEAFADNYRGIVVESSVNYELLVEGTGCNAKYAYPNSTGLYGLSKIAEFDGTNWKLRGGACAEYYAYNADYSISNAGEVQLPISFNFDYCSDCLNKYPNRIVWSPKSFSEEKSDTYRINLVNDYTTVGEGKGELIGIHYDKNRMLVLAESTCLLMAPNPQVINTDVDTAYIGTGDFLAIPPAEFAKTDYGFGGCQGRLAFINTEYGLFWCDQAAGRVFSFDGNVNELSSKEYGNFNFFRQNLPRKGSWSVTDSTVSGLGVQLSYDPFHKRVIIHKSDFILIGVDDGDFANNGNYENASLTMTFSPELKSWISFHSWQPEFIFSDRTNLYTTVDNNIWKHSKFESEFYGFKFNFTVEYVAASIATTNLEVLNFYAQTINEEGLDKEYPSFDTFWCYSNKQSTGEQNLIPKSDYPRFWSNTQKVIVHAEDTYRISGIRDISNGSNVSSILWADKQSAYRGKQGYIDKVPVNVDLNTTQWKLIPLKNKYHIIRLSYSGSDKIIFNITETVTKPSIL